MCDKVRDKCTELFFPQQPPLARAGHKCFSALKHDLTTTHVTHPVYNRHLMRLSVYFKECTVLGVSLHTKILIPIVYIRGFKRPVIISCSNYVKPTQKLSSSPKDKRETVAANRVWTYQSSSEDNHPLGRSVWWMQRTAK